MNELKDLSKHLQHKLMLEYLNIRYVTVGHRQSSTEIQMALMRSKISTVI